MCYTQFVMLLYDCVKGTLELKHGLISSSTQMLHISILQSSGDFQHLPSLYEMLDVCRNK